MAVLAFASGIASYVLVDRKESLAQLIALFLLVSWLWLLLDNWLRERIEQRFGITLSPTLVRFVLQMVHQESLFFALPFFSCRHQLEPRPGCFHGTDNVVRFNLAD